MWNKKEMSQLDGMLTRVPLTLTLNIWPWIFMVKLYLSNGRPDCHAMKGTGVDRMPGCETLRKWVNWMLRWMGYLWPWIFKVKLDLGNRRTDCHGTKGTGVDRMPWCKTLWQWVNWTLTLTFDLEFSRSNCILGMGGLIVMEWKGWESIACPDVKHNHYVTPRQRILLPNGVT